MAEYIANLDEDVIFGASTFVSPVIFSLMCLWVPFAVLTTADYWRRRATFPITARLSSFVVLSNVFLGLWALLANGLALANHFSGGPMPCELHRILSLINFNMFQLTGVFIFAVRCFRLYFAFELTSIRSQAQSHIDFALNPRLNWFVQRRHWISMQNLTRVLWIAIAFHSGLAIFEAFGVESVKCGARALADVEGNESGRAWNREMPVATSGVLSFLYAVAAVPIAYQYRNFDRDVFRLRDEVSRTGWVAGCCGVLFAAFENVPGMNDVPAEVFPVHRVVLLFGVIAIHYYQIVVPLQLSVATEFERARLPGASRGTSGGGGRPARNFQPASRAADLRTLLADKRMYAAFSKYLKKELSVENLIFWNEVESYRAMAVASGASMARVFARAEVIIDRFLTPKTLLEVNVPRETRMEPRERLFQIERVRGKAPDADVCSQLAMLFNAAQREVLALMARDPLPRFMNTPEFAKINDHGRTIEAWVSRTIEPMGPELDRAHSSSHVELVSSVQTSPRSYLGSTGTAMSDPDPATPSRATTALGGPRGSASLRLETSPSPSGREDGAQESGDVPVGSAGDNGDVLLEVADPQRQSADNALDS